MRPTVWNLEIYDGITWEFKKSVEDNTKFGYCIICKC